MLLPSLSTAVLQATNTTCNPPEALSSFNIKKNSLPLKTPRGSSDIQVYTCPRQMFRMERIYPFGTDICQKDKVNTGCQEHPRGVFIGRRPL